MPDLILCLVKMKNAKNHKILKFQNKCLYIRYIYIALLQVYYNATSL